jgi:hypothetical protein
MIELPAIFVANYDDGFGFESGQVWNSNERIFVTCPGCGQRYALSKPPFTFDPASKSIGPASIKLGGDGCQLHGYLHGGIWKIDAPCQGKPREHCFRKDAP